MSTRAQTVVSIAFIVAVAMFLVSCGESDRDIPARYEIGDTTLEITVDPVGTVDSTQMTVFSLNVKNIGDSAVTFEPSDHDFWILNENDGMIWTSAEFRAGGALPEVTLPGGDSVRYMRTWELTDGQLQSSAGGPIRPGEYHLVGQLIVIPRLDGGQDDGVPVYLVSDRVKISIAN